MDAVAYAFCSSVLAIIGGCSSIGNQFSSKIWRKAAADEALKRLTCVLYIAYEDGVWSYQLKFVGVHFTFSELKKLEKRHVEKISILSGTLQNRCSFQEIKVIVKYTLPCVNLTDLLLYETKNFPQGNLLELVSHYESSIFGKIYAIRNDDSTVEFLLPHLESDFLKNLIVVGNTCSADLKAAIGEFALNKQCKNLHFDIGNADFDMPFFEQLFEKRITHNEHYLLYFSVEEAALKEFKKDLRITESELLHWQREDGVRVGAHCARKMICVQLELQRLS